jgi:SAM-dependent methyltransferase
MIPCHRSWEWAMGLYALELLGKLNREAAGLELAAGREPVMYYLSRRVKKMYAGDMYGHGGYASDGTAPGDLPQNPAKYATIPFNAAALNVSYMDARNLSSFSDASLDFVISFSSIEHFGGETASAQSIREQARVLRPGGVAVVVTGAQRTLVGAVSVWSTDMCCCRSAAGCPFHRTCGHWQRRHG